MSLVPETHWAQGASGPESVYPAGLGLAPSYLAASSSSASAGNVQEIMYAEITAPVTVSATTEASANLIVSAGNVTWPGGVAVTIEFYASRVHATAATAGAITFCLYAAGVSVGRWGEWDTNNANNLAQPIQLTRRDIPNAGTELIEVRAFRTGVDIAVDAGPGGVGNYMPAFIRIMRAS